MHRSVCRLSALLVFAWVVILGGCDSGDPPEPGDAFQVTDSAGTSIAVSTAPLWGPGEGWRVAHEPELVIGSIEGGNPAEQFSRPTALFSLSDGTIIVVESTVGEVRAFSPAGVHLWTAGGRGDGPGEFSLPSRALRIGGDTIVVQNAPRTKLVLFGPDGAFVRGTTVDMDAMGELARFVECVNQVLSDLSILACVEHPTEGRLPSDPGPGLIRRMAQYVRVPADLSRVDTLGEFGGPEQFGIRLEGRSMYALHRFHSRTQIAVGSDPVRVAIAINPEYDIEIWAADGTLERVIRRTDGARAPTEEELRDARDELGRFARDPAAISRLQDEVPAPSLVPAVGSLVFTTGGELLVGRSAPPGEAPDGRRLLDVFDPVGRWLGTIDAPPGGIHEIGEDYLLMMRYDELQVPYIERYALVRG